jgi:hypothetical protein
LSLHANFVKPRRGRVLDPMLGYRFFFLAVTMAQGLRPSGGELLDSRLRRGSNGPRVWERWCGELAG